MPVNRLYIFLLIVVAAEARAQQTWKIVESTFISKDPPFRQCHASTIVELPGGELFTAFFAGTHEGHKDVGIWTARFDGKKWSKVEVAATGVVNDTLRFPCWNPVLFLNNDKTLFLFYKVGPNPREWWGMVRTSSDEGRTWSVASRLPHGILGPVKNKPVQLADGTILSPSSTETESKWSAHIERSVDKGATWEKVPVDPGAVIDVIQPSILLHGDSLQILCRSRQGKVAEAWSGDGGKTWGHLRLTNLPNPNSGTDAVTLQNGRHIIVFNPDVPGKEWYHGRAQLNVAESANGNDWETIAILEKGKDEEFSYPAVIQAKDGRIHITYTHDRKNIRHVVLQKNSPAALN